MEHKRLTIWVYIAITIITTYNCLAAEKQIEQKEQIKTQINQRLKNQEKRLQDIKELVLVEREHIEYRYKNRIKELQMLAEEQAKNLGYPYRMLWSQFIKMAVQIPSEDRYFLTESFLEHKTYKLRAAMMDSYSLYAAQTFLADDNARQFVAHIANSNNYTSLIRKEARKVLTVMEELRSALSRHQRQRESELAKLEQWEKELKEDVFRVMRYIKSLPQTPKRGVLSAIAYGEDKSLAMVDEKIVYEGDRIQGIKIMKIRIDRVEFEKNGKVWTQKLGEAQEAFWQ
jgi:hypothetical protein